MNKKNITPNPTQPVDRVPTGQLPIELAELSEDTLSSSNITPAIYGPCYGTCASGCFDGGGAHGCIQLCSYEDDSE